MPALKELSLKRLTIETVRAVIVALEAKRAEKLGESRKLIRKAIAVKQFEQTEKELTKELIPFFVMQGRSMVSKLEKQEEIVPKESEAEREKQAVSLARKIFDPAEWTAELTNRVLPVLAVSMAEAAVAHLLTLGLDILKKKGKKEKATTATEWIKDNEEDWEELLEVFAASKTPLGIMTEVPLWMEVSITKRLSESFKEDYWDKISETTMGDAETVLRRGLRDGWSIDRMAKEMRGYFEEGGFRYARARSENIARTESGNALNGARKDSVAWLQEELGDKVPMKQSWLSVLGNTTRASHAHLDRVPENENKMWVLGGFEIPWPAHYSLPPENRCNCMCSLTIEFGMQDAEAERLIGEHAERMTGE